MLIRFGNPGTMMFMKFILSGPSVIAPKAKRAEYLNFQSYETICCETNAITGSIIAFPKIYATLSRQQPAERATPHSSESSSSDSKVTF